MPIEIVNWLEIPVADMQRARNFYETVFDCKLIDLEVGNEVYPCIPDKSGGFSGALVQYDFTRPGKDGPLVYLNAYDDVDGMLKRIAASGGTIIKQKSEIAPGFGWYALFADSEGNLLALQQSE